MSETTIDLSNLIPAKTEFELSRLEGKKIKLRHWSLRVRRWAEAKYTSKGLADLFKELQITKIAELSWFMLEDESRALFKDQDDFEDHVASPKDQVALIKALLRTVGIGEPEIKKIDEALKKKGLTTSKKKK